MDFESFVSKKTKRLLKELLKEYLRRSKKLRRDFPASTKKLVSALQNYRCNYCKTRLDVVNFDHIDGDRSNNSIFNCQALCPNCHARKTRKNSKIF